MQYQLIGQDLEARLGLCRYCGLKAGLLKDSHQGCLQDASEAVKKIESLIAVAVNQGTPAAAVEPLIASLKQQGRLSDRSAQEITLAAINSSALVLAREHPVSNEIAEAVYSLFSTFHPTIQQEAKKYPGYISLLFSNTIFQVLHGQTPHFDPQTPIPFRLNSGEQPIVKRNTQLAEYRAVNLGGDYQSISLPVGGGLYYRLGASTPHSQQVGLVLVDQGEMLITTEAVYFGGNQQDLKIEYTSILRLEPFADGVGIYPDDSDGKVLLPATLGFDDGWFFYNLISALSARTAV